MATVVCPAFTDNLLRRRNLVSTCTHISASCTRAVDPHFYTGTSGSLFVICVGCITLTPGPITYYPSAGRSFSFLLCSAKSFSSGAEHNHSYRLGTTIRYSSTVNCCTPTTSCTCTSSFGVRSTGATSTATCAALTASAVFSGETATSRKKI